MTQPFGFVPPVAIPAVGGAANAIIPTAGLLGGAIAGAKAGAVLGPKGIVVGAVAGALLAPLLFPSRLAPGTLPGGLDPGFNPAPKPSTAIIYPKGKITAGDLSDGAPLLSFAGSYRVIREAADFVSCNKPDEPGYSQPEYVYPTVEWSFYGSYVELDQDAVKGAPTCQTSNWVWDNVIYIYGIKPDGLQSTIERERARKGNFYTGNQVVGELTTTYAEVLSFTVDGVEQDLGQQQPIDPSTIPRPEPTPLPIKPLTPEPEAPPLPGPVPLPEPEPQPQPLDVPNPGNPDAPPITIPKAPPAVPQTPTPTTPGTNPVPQPVRPLTPTIPTPIPGVPTVPEPTPDPNIAPAPGPAPLPIPGPTPIPETDPQPGETPIPVPPQTPIPTIPDTPTPPDTTTPTTPDGSVAPVPTPSPVPTPPDVHFPVPGGPGVTPGGTRPNVSAIAAEIGRVEQKVANIQSGRGGGGLADLLFLLPLLLDFLEGDIPGTTYQLQGICETVEDGEAQPIAEFPVEPAKNLGAIINRLDTIDQMLQQHLAWKTPTCSTRPVLAGDWRTVSFISDEVSPYGSARLRKRFRYRSLSGLGLPQVIDHWADFTWQAGPVCVQHAGSSWGTPQVWAASIDEGKRVIRHAAGEAGIDPDQDGRWVVSGSDSSRVGLPGTMRVNRKGGYYWITARDGSERRPIVGSIGPDP